MQRWNRRGYLTLYIYIFMLDFVLAFMNKMCDAVHRLIFVQVDKMNFTKVEQRE